jgi:hypothetical protein
VPNAPQTDQESGSSVVAQQTPASWQAGASSPAQAALSADQG